ncbi:MAG: TetR/AcrR family transcriptional regulator, partial [Clostridia bacterium]|nr:TetR/AcrR family transcriptional regulator [Clostridia bacterium]
MSEKNIEKIKDEMSQRIISAAQRIATERGAQTVTARSILQELGITNRVFYNCFSNIDEVLDIVYRNTAKKIRVDLCLDFDGEEEFFNYVTETVIQTLLASYEAKMRFNQYVFETDS